MDYLCHFLYIYFTISFTKPFTEDNDELAKVGCTVLISPTEKIKSTVSTPFDVESTKYVDLDERNKDDRTASADLINYLIDFQKREAEFIKKSRGLDSVMFK